MIQEKASALEFARLVVRDLDQILELERNCFSCPWTGEQYRAMLGNEGFKVFGLRQGPRLVAYLSFYHVADEMEIHNLAVAPEDRGHGCATRLLSVVLQMAAKMGIKKCFLEVRENNEPARRLYASAGFEQQGVRKRYYPDTREDALVLVKHLAAATEPPDSQGRNTI